MKILYLCTYIFFKHTHTHTHTHICQVGEEKEKDRERDIERKYMKKRFLLWVKIKKV